MNKDFKYKLRQVGFIVVLWMLIGFIITIYDHLVLSSNYSLGFSDNYSLLIGIIRNVGAGFIGGVLGGSFLVFYINVKYQDKRYGYTLLAVFFSFILIIALIAIIMGVILVPMQTGRPLYDPVSIAALQTFLRDPAPLKAAIVWSLIVAVTQLMLQVSQKFGRGAFLNLILGRYQTPKEEKRIFMFLDLNSSTMLAEKLGDHKYHLFLKQFFADITNPILENGGTIYQYVGDEVLVTWKHEPGANDRCLQCYFDIQQKIDENRKNYIAHFGVVPTFKAGIHCGKVVAGEIGVIKRDITFSGDVLNTASRIQNMCKEFRVNLITSNDIVEDLISSTKYIIKPLGSIKLRGKANELFLNSVDSVIRK